MAEIELTQGRIAIVDDEDYERVSQHKWCLSGNGDGNEYAAASINGSMTRMHNFILGAKGVDHVNRDGLDNRKANLRVCTQAENARNRKTPKNFRGVFFEKRKCKRPFIARISFNRKYIHLGSFYTFREAIEAYNEGAKKYHGEYATLNDLTKIEEYERSLFDNSQR